MLMFTATFGVKPSPVSVTVWPGMAVGGWIDMVGARAAISGVDALAPVMDPVAVRVYVPGVKLDGTVTALLKWPAESDFAVPVRLAVCDPLEVVRTNLTVESGAKPWPVTVTEPPGRTVFVLSVIVGR